jgi:DNA-directed RNA polymerase specialized sigma24 family protein
MRSSLEFLFSTKKPAAKVSDDALIRKIKQGSEPAFSLLYDSHVQELFNYGMHVCDDPQAVRSCLKELFVGVWEQRHNLGVTTSITSCLFKSFRKLLIEKILNRKFEDRVINYAPTEFKFRLLANDNLFGDKASLLDNLQIVAELTGRQAEALFLKIDNRFSDHEVAFVMDLDVSTIYRLVSASVEILRKRMANTVNADRAHNVFKAMDVS